MGLNCIAVIPAAGSGSRLRQITGGSSKLLFKLLTPVGERSLLFISVQRLLESELFSGVVVACSQANLDECKQELAPLCVGTIPVDFVIGGKTRQESVFRALEHLENRNISHVAIHDAARPFVSIQALREVVAKGQETGAAILVERINSTLKRLSPKSEIVETFPRTEFTLAQTPQVFDYNLIFNAHQEGAKANFVATDDSQLVERLGIEPRAVVNKSLNPKVTEPADLELATFLANRI